MFALCLAAVWAAAVVAHAQAPGPTQPVAQAAETAPAPVPPPGPDVIRLKIGSGLEASAPAPLRSPELQAYPPAESVADSVGLSPTYFWIAASATIMSASLGGFYALRVRDLYDEATMKAAVSPRRIEVQDQMRTAEVTADVFLFGSLALAIGTTILAFHIDWSGREALHERASRTHASRRSFW